MCIRFPESRIRLLCWSTFSAMCEGLGCGRSLCNRGTLQAAAEHSACVHHENKQALQMTKLAPSRILLLPPALCCMLLEDRVWFNVVRH